MHLDLILVCLRFGGGNEGGRISSDFLRKIWPTYWETFDGFAKTSLHSLEAHLGSTNTCYIKFLVHHGTW